MISRFPPYFLLSSNSVSTVYLGAVISITILEHESALVVANGPRLEPVARASDDRFLGLRAAVALDDFHIVGERCSYQQINVS
jgi:hypothetical protein